MEHLGQIMTRLGAGRRPAERTWRWRSSGSEAVTGEAHLILQSSRSSVEEGDGLGDEETRGCEPVGEEQADAPLAGRWGDILSPGRLPVIEGSPLQAATCSAPLSSSGDGSPDEHECSRCHGSGYLRADVPYGHPQFGKALACVCTQERQKAQRRQFLLELSRLAALSEFREASFASFDALAPGVLQAYQAALDFAEAPAGWLVLSGGNGCGKTHLAMAIARQRLQEGETVLVQVVPDLLDYLRATFAPTSKVPYSELFGRMREADLLVLDDLGAQQNTAWANEKLFQLLNYRYNAHLPTVITTNSLDLADIEPRICSRVSDRRLVRLVTLAGAGDYRQGDTSYSHSIHETGEDGSIVGE